MATGLNEGFGRSVQRAVDKATEPEPAVTHQPSTAGSHAMKVLWISSCAMLGLVQLRECCCRIGCVRGFFSAISFFSPLNKNANFVFRCCPSAHRVAFATLKLPHKAYKNGKEKKSHIKHTNYNLRNQQYFSSAFKIFSHMCFSWLTAC